MKKSNVLHLPGITSGQLAQDSVVALLVIDVVLPFRERNTGSLQRTVRQMSHCQGAISVYGLDMIRAEV